MAKRKSATGGRQRERAAAGGQLRVRDEAGLCQGERAAAESQLRVRDEAGLRQGERAAAEGQLRVGSEAGLRQEETASAESQLRVRDEAGLWQESVRTVSASREENTAYISQVLPVRDSFDIIQKDLYIGERAASFFFVDGFMKDESMQKVLDALLKVTKEAMPADATEFSRKCVPYVEVDVLTDFDMIIKNILSGVTCLFIEGYEACVAIDCRTYPARSVEEPDKDKSLRGSRDGFVETIVFNTAMMRRRIRDPHLIMEMTEVGESSRTDVAICYMEDRVDQGLLDRLMERIGAIHTDALRMNQQSLAECLFRRKWYNPFPKFKFTERPDTAAACLLEGKVVLLVDNSPSAMILPTSIFDMIEEANDYYFPTITNIYLKAARILITVMTVFLTPVFLLVMQNPAWIPPVFSFIAIHDMINIPLIWQLLILEVAIDGLRLAALNTPSMLSTPLSVIAGLVMGEFSVQSGWFNSEVMLYMAFVAVANYTQPNFELGYALKFMRLLLLVLTAFFNTVGFAAGCVIIILSICFNRTLSGRNYLDVRLSGPGRRASRSGTR